MYHHMIQVAARVFFRIGSLGLLKTLSSFIYFRNVSFEILSKSFHKQTIILMSYMYCMLINWADNFE